MNDALPLFPVVLPSVPFEERHSLPHVSGIYFALAANGDVLYVGATQNLYQRWIGHHHTENLNEFSCMTISYYTCEITALASIEQAMISQFQPLLNGRTPHLYKPSKLPRSSAPNTFIRITPETARRLKVAASLQSQKTSMLALIRRLVDEELKRLNAADITNSSLDKESSHGSR